MVDPGRGGLPADRVYVDQARTLITHEADRLLTLNDTFIEDTFAEAFPMTAARLLVTAESVAWAEELVVVDSGSRDETVSICRELGARVHVTPDWPGYGAEKNRAYRLRNAASAFSASIPVASASNV